MRLFVINILCLCLFRDGVCGGRGGGHGCGCVGVWVWAWECVCFLVNMDGAWENDRKGINICLTHTLINISLPFEPVLANIPIYTPLQPSHLGCLFSLSLVSLVSPSTHLQKQCVKARITWVLCIPSTLPESRTVEGGLLS